MKINCPKCGKELIPLEPFDEEGVYDFWCDKCDIDIRISVNKEIRMAEETQKALLEKFGPELDKIHKAVLDNKFNWQI